jgi:hypothetical protein
LTDEQATLCRTLLCQELMKISNLLASDKDCNGRKLIYQTKQLLMVKFILSPCFKGNAREFPDGGGKVDAGPCPDNLLGGE